MNLTKTKIYFKKENDIKNNELLRDYDSKNKDNHYIDTINVELDKCKNNYSKIINTILNSLVILMNLVFITILIVDKLSGNCHIFTAYFIYGSIFPLALLAIYAALLAFKQIKIQDKTQLFLLGLAIFTNFVRMYFTWHDLFKYGFPIDTFLF